MTYLIEISPEYMAQIEAEFTQSATTATDDSLANYATLRLHEQLGGIQFVEIEEGYYIFPEEDEPDDDNAFTPDSYSFITQPSEEDDLPF
jgi:hypothetical protein